MFFNQYRKEAIIEKQKKTLIKVGLLATLMQILYTLEFV